MKKAGKQKQKLLTDLLLRELPEKNREKLVREEERRRRLELQEAKENIWKKWRGKSKKSKENIEENGVKMLERIESMIKQNREEKEEKRKKKEKERDKEIEDEKEKKAQKVIRKEKKKKLEEQWEMLRWITNYVNENELDWENENQAEMEMSVAEKPEKDEEMAEFKLHGGEEGGRAEPRNKVMDEPGVSVAKLPANVGTRTAKLQNEYESGKAEQEVTNEAEEMGLSLANMPANERIQTAEFELPGGGGDNQTEPGDESGRAEQEVTNVVDEMELSLAKMPANERVITAEFELQGGDGGSQTEPGDDSDYDGDRARLEAGQSEVSDRLHESGKAELQDDQFPRPIQHQSMTLGSENLYCYPSNSGKPFGQAGGELRYLAPFGGQGGPPFVMWSSAPG